MLETEQKNMPGTTGVGQNRSLQWPRVGDVIMLRLRIASPVPQAVAPGAAFALDIRLTNESGSAVHCCEGVSVQVQAVDAVTLNPLPHISLLASPRGAPRTAKAPAESNVIVTDLLGRCDAWVKVAPARDRSRSIAIRLQLAVVTARPVFLSPSPSPSVWPAVLLPPCMAGISVPQPAPSGDASPSATATADKKAEKKRRAEAFASEGMWEYGGGEDDGDGVGRGLVAAAKGSLADPSASLCPPVLCVPVATTILCVGDCAAPHSDAGDTYADSQIQVVPVCAWSFRMYERVSVVGPGFGSVVWDCAVVLCEYLCANAGLLKLEGARVAEVSTGTGIVAVCLARLGADVTATDLPLILPLAQDNVSANAGSGSVAVVAHAWGRTRLPSPPLAHLHTSSPQK